MPAEKKLRYTFSFLEKIHSQKDFEQALKKGRRLAHPAILIYAYGNPANRQARRLALITSRKVGIAADRNRVKRRLREIFRLNKHFIKPGTDLLFVPKSGAVGMSYKELEAVVLSLITKAGAMTE
ncbi:MAG: ribonuclease P protein component [Elusimicrobia bacterium RIFOXYB12_FULL_50_12]|nr:MAG: ribonuclease P protein component [Elusimicrobia bacterium RIFOXYA12_FULL_49_49]OGS10765.1 MAG: ribonuclease P protein component [Elusimicrobia bacterium RIFOXYB1_FULL_48_9]OGS16479.1 MAG: ribonuclease P protein component [Elusimicrobia bacterium RIFOXYA2_FULL_47_53]OGS26667.1 MAG: ribonuclease P protein component [Elusimicrobia bacterium RIFOXYB12_FULL_50_12]OGS31216.1 MAG: ribonuclease P protein component [Elusimicrobia bacterium RIFOXYB2_FULL_46_23]